MARYINIETAENSLRQYAEQKHANGEIELANGILKAVCKLRTLPTVDVKEVAREKWETNSDYPDRLICSRCGYMEDVWWADKGTNFCLFCGADMRGGGVGGAERIN